MTPLGLFCTFFYVGLFTIGGGLVAITLMYKPIVESGLVSAELFYNMVAISESTPGPVGINMATYVGHELYGIPGALLATFGEVLPSLVIIVVIARFFMRFHEAPLVKAAFSGLRPAVTGMIAMAAAQVLLITVFNPLALTEAIKSSTIAPLQSIVNLPQALFFIGALIFLKKTTLHPILVVALGALFGVVCL
jgi:chromate transporter